MIGSLRGQVLERDLAGWVLVEVSGVGYVVHVSPRALAELEPSAPVFLYVHHHIREDTQQLYGFLVGQIMKRTGGRADARLVNEELRRQLG